VGIGNVCGGGGVGIGLGRRGLAGRSGFEAVFGGGGGIACVRIIFSRFFW
jgi:hypothetical protein